MYLLVVWQQFELIPQSPCPQPLRDQRKRFKNEEDQEQRKWAWKKGRNETYNRTEEETQFLDMNEVQQELDFLQDKNHEDHAGKDDQTIEDNQKEEVQKTKYNQMEDEVKKAQDIQKEEEVQTGWVNYNEEQTSSSSSGEAQKTKEFWQGGRCGWSGRATGGSSQSQDPLGGRSGNQQQRSEKNKIIYQQPWTR